MNQWILSLFVALAFLTGYLIGETSGYRDGQRHVIVCHSTQQTDCLWVDGTADYR